jgi:hypothetical protein
MEEAKHHPAQAPVVPGKARACAGSEIRIRCAKCMCSDIRALLLCVASRLPEIVAAAAALAPGCLACARPGTTPGQAV